MRLWIRSTAHTPKTTTWPDTSRETPVSSTASVCVQLVPDWPVKLKRCNSICRLQKMWRSMTNKEREWQNTDNKVKPINVLYVLCVCSAGLYHFLKAFSGNSAAHEWNLLVLLLVIWAADFSWELTCADIWLHAPHTLRWCFSLSAFVLLRGNVLWTCTSAQTMRSAKEEYTVKPGQHTTLFLRVGAWVGGLADAQTRQANLRVLTHLPEMSGQVEKLSCCSRCWLMCVCEFSRSSILANRILLPGKSPYPTKTLR